MAESSLPLAASTPSSSPALVWVGRVLSALVVLALVASAGMKLSHSPKLVEHWVGHFGFSEGILTGVGIVELLVAILYAVPQTSVLGAILAAAYFGGATLAHLHGGDPVFVPVLVGVMAWAGLFLRDARIRALIPLRKP